MVGFVLLAIEILVIPGFGLIGVLGCVGILTGGAVAWSQLGPVYGVLAFGGGIGAAGLMLWLFPKTAAGRAMVLTDDMAAAAPPSAFADLAGKHGKALTALRPAGTAEIEDRTVDVVTDGVYVEAGTRVRVALVEGARVVVEPVPVPVPVDET